jgi:integrase
MERLVAGLRWVDSRHVFTTTVGTPIHAATVTRAFHAALEKAGLPPSRFHDLRHTAATFLLAQGMTLEDVKQLSPPHRPQAHVRGRSLCHGGPLRSDRGH